MGKSYVVFVGREPGVYQTWEATSKRINGYKGTIHRSFKSKEEAEAAYVAYMEKQPSTTSFTSSTTSSSTSQRNPEKTSKLNAAVLALIKENQCRALNVAKLIEEIRKQLEALQFDDN